MELLLSTPAPSNLSWPDVAVIALPYLFIYFLFKK